jgi:hypothetical protein
MNKALVLLLTKILDLELPLGVKGNIVPPEVASPLSYHGLPANIEQLYGNELSWLPYYGISSSE